MGFFKKLGHLAGSVTGLAVSTPVYLVGEIIKSDYIKEIATVAADVTAHTGKVLGSVTDSTLKCASGIITQDSSKAEEGFSEVIESATNTMVGIGKGLINTVEKGIDTVSAIADGDSEKAIKIGKELVKIAAVSTLAVGICDVIGGIDTNGDGIPDLEENDLLEENEYHALGGNPNGGTGPNFVYEEQPPVYWVNAPHTSNGGYYRTMPDASISNNLKL